MLDALEEARRGRTVDQAVVEGQTQRQHASHGDLVCLFIHHDRARDNAPQAEDRTLGQVDDRSEGVDLVHAKIRDGEGRTGQVVGADGCGARGLDQPPRFARDRFHGHAVGATYDRRDQTGVGFHGYADVDVAVLDESILGE